MTNNFGGMNTGILGKTSKNSFHHHHLLLMMALLVLNLSKCRCFIMPCVNCRELHVELHLNATPQTEKVSDGRERHGCVVPCKCPAVFPKCQDGVPAVIDGCGCCLVCARQQGDLCNKAQVCDSTRKLECTYSEPASYSGICRVRRGHGCKVGDTLYHDGETFKLDCRTQCTCQNGTYGCVSLCPHEKFRPSSRCRHPQLVQIPHSSSDSCCREWLCDSTLREDRAEHCQHYSSQWTLCSKTCGMGVSTRISNDNPECQLKNETRLCFLRPCSEDGAFLHPLHGHHVRKNHVCRATIRSTVPLRLSDGANCTSVDMYQPKYCGVCTSNRCCGPHTTTTKKIPFYCVDEDGPNVIEKDFLWIIKCDCTSAC